LLVAVVLLVIVLVEKVADLVDLMLAVERVLSKEQVILRDDLQVMELIVLVAVAAVVLMELTTLVVMVDRE
jgi:hypothetical protein